MMAKSAPVVGVVIVKDGKLLATGYRGESGDAEITASIVL